MSATHPPALQDYSLVISLPVQWSDQDAFGHVNNTVPIRWFESARVAYWEKVLDAKMTAEHLGPILAAVQCSYRRQLNYPDTVRIGARVAEFGRSSMKMAHVVYSEQQQAVAAEGESTVVMFDYQAQRPTRIPAEFRQAVEKLEGVP